ncbi:MAG: hypothetical protein LDLANPLL_00228 [Turneriella sp.]|nr:hypothetical protein [Turneriella sp.]
MKLNIHNVGLQSMERRGLFIVRIAKFFLATVLLGFTFFLFQCKPWKSKSPQERANAMVNRISQELSLNGAQLELVNEIKEDILEQQLQDKPERDKQLKEFSTLFISNSIDNESLLSLKKRHDALRSNTELLFIRSLIRLHKVLTPEQRTRAVNVLLKSEDKNAITR